MTEDQVEEIIKDYIFNHLKVRLFRGNDWNGGKVECSLYLKNKLVSEAYFYLSEEFNASRAIDN